MADVSLIVGLGNPGREYHRTRHNAGFMGIDELAARWRVSWTSERKFNAWISRARRGSGTVLLCKPQTFMNASGEAAGPVAAYYNVPTGRVLAVVDDADLPLGSLRLRPSGSSGGHHGLESMIAHLGTREFPRLRLGIGRQDPAQREITGYVLGEFSRSELGLWEKVLTRACDQIECWLDAGIGKAMSLFNGSIESVS
jgi:PTH1 family peptidyl-tRNA hydrolase